jgi:hypothetical protein
MEGVLIAIGATVLAVMLLGVVLAWRRGQHGRALTARREALALADVRARLTAAGEALRALDLDHAMPGADAAGSAAYAAAVEHYERADAALERPAPDALDLERAAAALDAAESALATARERFRAHPQP